MNKSPYKANSLTPAAKDKIVSRSRMSATMMMMNVNANFANIIRTFLCTLGFSHAIGQTEQFSERMKAIDHQIDFAIASDDLEEMKKLAGQITSFEERSNPHVRKEKIGLWTKLRSSIMARMDPKFDLARDLGIGNIRPEGTNLPAGVAPEAIKDPKKRRDYEKALGENERKVLRAKRELALMKLRNEIDRRVAIHCAWEYESSAEGQRTLERDLEGYPDKEKILANARTIPK